MKQHSLPESRSALAKCSVPLSSISVTTAVASRTLFRFWPEEAQLTGSEMAEAEFLVGSSTIGAEVGFGGADSTVLEFAEAGWVSPGQS